MPVSLTRGEVLVRQGEEADALYLVLTGRFEVLLDGRVEPVAEIAAGDPIGEIAFFAGGLRTASVRAERDSIVLKLSREDFDRLASASPAIWSSITATLARRLAETTVRNPSPRYARPRTICLLRAGAAPIPEAFINGFKAACSGTRTLFLDAKSREEIVRVAAPAAADETRRFNELERRFDTLIYVADSELSPWSQKAIRQADLALLVGRAEQSEIELAPNELEILAARLHRSRNIRLALVHERPPPYYGTRAWLKQRPWLHAHDHLGASNTDDYARLLRFLNGTARGLVACGGGAFSSAHIGVYQALREAGVVFDIMGGTSGGSAMAAAFVRGVDMDVIEAGVHDIFVTQKAMRRWTWPRYSLLDPNILDEWLARYYTSVDIEDLPLPFFAVATNLSRNEPICLRKGPLWEAVRASSAIPALLPPVVTVEGEMLVDGCLVENVPIETMRRLKAGPNVVVDFNVPGPSRCVRHEGPAMSRLEIFVRSLTRGLRRTLPPGPSPQAVLMRALTLNNRRLRERLRQEDTLIEPPMPHGVSHLDWHRHSELRAQAYAYTRATLQKRELGLTDPTRSLVR